MSLEVEYGRPYQKNEPEILQNIIIKYVRYNSKSMYPEKINSSILDKHAKILEPYTVECEYQSDIRSKDKDKPWGVGNIYHPIQVKII